MSHADSHLAAALKFFAHENPASIMRDAAEVMSKYLGNVLSHEGEDKFRHIRIGNPIFQQRVAAATGATGVLIATGFKQVFVHSPCFGQVRLHIFPSFLISNYVILSERRFSRVASGV